jgi:hypothetical protein
MLANSDSIDTNRQRIRYPLDFLLPVHNSSRETRFKGDGIGRRSILLGALNSAKPFYSTRDLEIPGFQRENN